jgi:hypothetical protein
VPVKRAAAADAAAWPRVQRWRVGKRIVESSRIRLEWDGTVSAWAVLALAAAAAVLVRACSCVPCRAVCLVALSLERSLKSSGRVEGERRKSGEGWMGGHWERRCGGVQRERSGVALRCGCAALLMLLLQL